MWFQPSIFRGHNFYATELIATLLTLLFILNLYWLRLMLKALYRYKKYGETSELQDSDKRVKKIQ